MQTTRAISEALTYEKNDFLEFNLVDSEEEEKEDEIEEEVKMAIYSWRDGAKFAKTAFSFDFASEQCFRFSD